jgi:hypothetical protein
VQSQPDCQTFRLDVRNEFHICGGARRQYQKCGKLDIFIDRLEKVTQSAPNSLEEFSEQYVEHAERLLPVLASDCLAGTADAPRNMETMPEN